MKASDYIAHFLHAKGVRTVFEMSGGMITHILDSLNRAAQIKVVSVHHEQAAAFAADAVGRMTGLPGVAMATSGPGATNLLTGMGSCHFDSSPALFITGQVNRHEQKGDRKIRQLGFQETDIVAMARPITKAAWLVQDPDLLPQMLEDAFELAISGRPGPVLLDIPMDIQRVNLTIPPGFPAKPTRPAAAAAPDVTSFLERLFHALRNARRPLLLLGGGVRSANAAAELREFVSLLGIPAVHSLMGVDLLPSDHPLRVGLIGSYGNRWANHALGTCDVMLVLGSRLDVRQTGAEVDSFKAGRTIFHVDIEPGEMNNRVTGCDACVSDLKSMLAAASGLARHAKIRAPQEWLMAVAELREQSPDTSELTDISGINPNAFMHQLAKASPAAAVVVDVGQHQMWAAQSFDIRQDQRFLTSGGMGAMGFALPAALGAACAVAPKPVLLIAGDGGFQTNIQELQTVVRNQLPIKMVIINNRCHGMVRQFQQSYFDGRYQSTFWGYSAPKFADVAAAYGIDALTVERPEQVEAALDRLWSDPSRPALLDVLIDTYANAYPKLAFGKPITEMEPLSKPLGMEST